MKSVKNVLPVLLCSVMALFGWAGCMDDEEFSTSPNDGLTFSKDTIAFDTIMTGVATNTYTFQVYNPGKKALRLARVFLAGGAHSPYRVNVDGTFLEGGEATDFEVRGGDSLRVFLFLHAPESDSDHPVEIDDRLVFLTEGGARNEVVLTAYGQDVVRLTEKVLTKDTILDAKRPYHITDSLVVAAGATLRVAPGVRFYFHPNAHLMVRGTLVAEGTANSPVVMRGDRLGYMFSEQPYDRIPGQWGGVVFASESYENILNFCDIHSGTFGIRCDSAEVETTTLLMENSVVHNVSGDALSVRHARVFVGNSQLTNSGGHCVKLRGGHSTFVHCTIGNFYAFAGGRGAALDFSNYDGETRLPLYAAEFYNSIVTGYSADDIMGSQSERYTEDAFGYLFYHCLLNTPEFEDARIQHCFWDSEEATVCRDKNFAPEFDLDRLIFTFGLAAESQAVGNADAAVSASFYPLDRNGNDRMADGAPDLGCYERIEE